MNEVSLFRLYLLRALYLFVVVGLGVVLWPGIVHHDKPWELARGTVVCMLAAYSVLCAFGVRYPLQMLPILLWEVLWKTLWFGIVALPQWWAGHLDESTRFQIFELSVVLLVYIAVPWGYVFNQYVKKPGDRWSSPLGRTSRGAPPVSAA